MSWECVQSQPCFQVRPHHPALTARLWVTHHDASEKSLATNAAPSEAKTCFNLALIWSCLATALTSRLWPSKSLVTNYPSTLHASAVKLCILPWKSARPLWASGSTENKRLCHVTCGRSLPGPVTSNLACCERKASPN